MGILILLAIPILAKVSYGVGVLVGFVAGIISGSITFHYVTIKTGSNIAAWFSGIVASAAIGAVLGSIVEVSTPIGIALGGHS